MSEEQERQGWKKEPHLFDDGEGALKHSLVNSILWSADNFLTYSFDKRKIYFPFSGLPFFSFGTLREEENYL